MDGSPLAPGTPKVRDPNGAAGFGGLTAARSADECRVSRSRLIEAGGRRSSRPAAARPWSRPATLSPAATLWCWCALALRAQKNTRVLLGEVVHVDQARHLVDLSDGRHVPYDWLIVATGARHAYFGHDEWEPFAPGLKKIDDATEIRRRVLLHVQAGYGTGRGAGGGGAAARTGPGPATDSASRWAGAAIIEASRGRRW